MQTLKDILLKYYNITWLDISGISELSNYAAELKLSPFVFKVLAMYSNIHFDTHLDFTSKIIKLLRAQIDISGNGSQRV